MDTAPRTTLVFDPAAFARGLEAAFDAIRARVQAGMPPARFDVDPV